jgi:formyl-CoA transferase
MLASGKDHSAYFLYWNANKRSVAIDLERPEGRALLLRMLPRYDVFMENYGPGVAEKLGLDYAALSRAHPALIYARIKGFGSDGPYSNYKCYDMVAQAAAGAFSVTGFRDGPPVCPGPTTGDSGTGVQAALAIVAAYVQRLRTGEGRPDRDRDAGGDDLLHAHARANGSDWGTLAVPRSGTGGADAEPVPCMPGGPNDYVYLVVATPRMWEQLCSALGRPELASDPRFKGWIVRHENGAALYDEIAKWTRAPSTRRWILAEAGVPCSAVLDTRDLFQDPAAGARLRERVQHEVLGEVPSRLAVPHVAQRRSAARGTRARAAHGRGAARGPGIVRGRSERASRLGRGRDEG